jgi:flavin reductase (DIM6/NTAB) family NADH-FMN oxidoreductase RutF
MSDRDPHKQLIAALGRIPSGLFVVTARHGEAETGVLASWVQQCSFEPPQVTLALKRERSLLEWLPEGAPFTLNILDASQTDMVAHFGRGFDPGQPAFLDLEVERLNGGAPVLTEALGYLSCRVSGRCTVGDHEMVLGVVLGGRVLGDGQPMVHIRKSGSHY